MKIAIVTLIINTKSGSRAPLEIAKELKKLGNSVCIFSLPDKKDNDEIKNLKKLEIDIKYLNGKMYLIDLANELKRGKFDLVSFHGNPQMFLGTKLSSIPIVRTYYGSQFDAVSDRLFPNNNLLISTLNRLANIYIRWVEGLVLKNSDKVIAISEYTRKEAQNIYSIPCETIYLGGGFESKKIMPSKRIKHKLIQILSVSRIVPYKGFHKTIEVFKKLNQKIPNIKLIIAGSSPNPKYLSYLKSISNKNIEIKVNFSDVKLAKIFQSSDIYASYDRYMFFGMPIIEAANFRLPSVAIAKCAASETIVHKKTGYLAKNTEEFEKYLEILIKNSNLRISMGNNAKIYCQKFSWKQLAKEYVRVFKSLK